MVAKVFESIVLGWVDDIVGDMIDDNNVKININGNIIKQVNFTKFLGIYIDEHLSWAQHIDYLSKKLHEM